MRRRRRRRRRWEELPGFHFRIPRPKKMKILAAVQ